MTYFDKLLELKGGDAKEAAKTAFEKCPKDFFDEAPRFCTGDLDFITCRDCWFSEVEE